MENKGIRLRDYEDVITQQCTSCIGEYKGRFSNISDEQLTVQIKNAYACFRVIFDHYVFLVDQKRIVALLKEIENFSKTSSTSGNCEIDAQKEQMLEKQIKKYELVTDTFYHLWDMLEGEEEIARWICEHKVTFPERHKEEYLQYIRTMSHECVLMLCRFIEQKLQIEEDREAHRQEKPKDEPKPKKQASELARRMSESLRRHPGP